MMNETKIQLIKKGSYTTSIPKNIILDLGLKKGDVILWKRQEENLILKIIK